MREERTQVEQLPTADSYMRNPVIVRYGEDGAIDYTMEAATGLYFNKQDRFELEQPMVVANRQGSSEPWRLRADEAHSEKRGKRVVMTGDVYAWQQRDNGRNELRTSRLLFLPDNNTAETDRKVELKSPGNVTTGVGLKANFDTEVYRLLANVQGRHYAQ